VNLEIELSSFATKIEASGYVCRIEKGDIRQNGVRYKDQVRRLTLTLPDGTEMVHETKGSSCEIKARSWLSEATNGAITTF